MQNLDTAIQNLTPVLAGMPLVDVHTATRVNAVQDSLKDINNTFKERKRLTSDPIIPRGSSDNPYVLGSCVWGSSENYNNPGGTRGYWGGFRDKDSATGGDVAATDTWHRDRQPMSFSPGATDASTNKQCDGVVMVLTRIYIPGGSGASTNNYTYQRKEFRRTALYDSTGSLVSISEETEIESDTNYGSGSAGGGI